jgi:hypothetical protein
MIKRDLILEEVLNGRTSFYIFINQIPPKEIIELHQKCFRNYYLESSGIISNSDAEELLFDYDIINLIRGSYEEYFVEIGRERTYEFFGCGGDKMMKKIIDYTYFDFDDIIASNAIINDISEDDIYHFEDELYFDSFSNNGLSEFITQLYFLWELFG